MQVEIVSPEAILFQGEADMVITRTVAGELGVLADHEPMVSALGYGELRIYEADTVTNRFGVFGGFMEVRDNVVSILSDDAVPADEIDAADAQDALAKAEAAMAEADEGDIFAKQALDRATAMVKITEG